jgi:hypothetical protein
MMEDYTGNKAYSAALVKQVYIMHDKIMEVISKQKNSEKISKNEFNTTIKRQEFATACCAMR